MRLLPMIFPRLEVLTWKFLFPSNWAEESHQCKISALFWSILGICGKAHGPSIIWCHSGAGKCTIIKEMIFAYAPYLFIYCFWIRPSHNKFVKRLQIEEQFSDLSPPAGDLSPRNLDSSGISRTNACDPGLFLFDAKGRSRCLSSENRDNRRVNGRVNGRVYVCSTTQSTSCAATWIPSFSEVSRATAIFGLYLSQPGGAGEGTGGKSR